MSSSELGMIHSVFDTYCVTKLQYGLKPLVQIQIMTVASLFIPHIFHLLAINKGKSHNAVFSKVLCKASMARQCLKQAGRDSVAFTADESFQMSRSWISWASLGLIGGALTPFMSWPAQPLSHVGWTHPDQVDRIHGYSPMDQFTLLQLLMWLMLDHLVWFCRYPEKSGTGLLAERCMLRQMR